MARAVKTPGLSFAARRKFWQVFTAHARDQSRPRAEQDDFERFMAEVKGIGRAVENGSVTLVGAGPGDPELLTLRAVRALQSADVILFDNLVSRESWTSPAARRRGCWSARPAMGPPAARTTSTR